MLLFKSFIPEVFLTIVILSQLVFNSYIITESKNNAPILTKEAFSQTFFALFCVFFLLLNSKIESFFFNFLFVNDSGGFVLKIIFILLCFPILFIFVRGFRLQKLNFFEYFTLFLFSILSLLLLISATDMLSAYLVIEMQTLSFYILSSIRRNSAFSTEAGLKYFISGAFFSGIFLLGCSLIYGVLGTLNFMDLNVILSFYNSSINKSDNALLIGILLINITFLFKISAFPFLFWAPDVYDGAPLASTVILSILPKIALFHFFIKWLYVTSVFFNEKYSILFVVVGIITILWGAVYAIRQTQLKRLLIFSSIAQTGFLVAALSLNSLNGLIAIYFFLVIYTITSILIWAHFSLFFSFKEKAVSVKKIDPNPLFLSSLSPFLYLNGLWSVSFIVIIFSIAGIPPLSGFLSKIFILFSLIEIKLIFFALLVVLFGAISVFYYLRLLKIIYFEPEDFLLKFKEKQIYYSMILNSFLFSSDCLIIVICLFFLAFFFCFPSLLLLLCEYIVLGSFFY